MIEKLGGDGGREFPRRIRTGPEPLFDLGDEMLGRARVWKGVERCIRIECQSRIVKSRVVFRVSFYRVIKTTLKFRGL